MRRSVLAQQTLRATIHDDIQKRTEDHQSKIRNLRVGRENLLALSAPAAAEPLVLLAHGDSWFDYPLHGNSPLPLGSTDIISHLDLMGAINPQILNISHHGDATTNEMALPKQQRLIEALKDKRNWMNGDFPDAILFSGGGNDIAGNQFCMFLDYAVDGSDGLDPSRFADALSMVEASYRDLFLFRDHYAPGVRIFAHDYDFPIPNGVRAFCVGPWLQPSLFYAGWTSLAKGEEIVKGALLQFSAMLSKLEKELANRFTLVKTQGTLSAADWANELHPYPDGFGKLAGAFISSLRGIFPGRI